MKNLITFGILAFAIFGISNIAKAEVYQPLYTSAYYNSNTYGGGMPTSRYGATESPSLYYQPTYAVQNYNNNYDQAHYQSSNTGYIPTNNQSQNVYGSDPLEPKQATVLSTNSGVNTNTKTISNNTTKNTTTTKSTNNTTNTNKTVANNTNSSEDTVTGSSYDENNNGNSIVALSSYGSDRFLPDTVFEWILIFFLILILIILVRMIAKKNHNHESPNTH